eukprot:6609326-Prymnesium_polylepis.1
MLQRDLASNDLSLTRRSHDSLAQGMAFAVPGKRPGGAKDGSALHEMSLTPAPAPRRAHGMRGA